MPMASADGRSVAPIDAFFTAVSAVTVTGLTTVDTSAQWSFLGQVIILIAIQVGGLGIVTIALLLARAVTRHLGVREKIFAQQSIGTTRLGEVGVLLRTVVLTTFAIEAALFALLTPRFMMVASNPWEGVWHGAFYAVSSFNNAGFSVTAGGLEPFADDPWILALIAAGVFIGSLGFPVFLTILQHRRRVTRWSLHARLTVVTTAILTVLGAVVWAVFEWSNANTIGSLSPFEKAGHALFASVMTRSGGFAITPTADSETVTLLASDALMFVGGGSASTAGGIKVATLAVLVLAIIAEARGDKQVVAGRRTIPNESLRLAISVTFLGASLVLTSTGLLMLVSDAPLDRILFETISAFATCGLSVGLSEELPPFGKAVLAVLMLAGRIGPIGLAAALALKQRSQLYSFPQERPIIG